MATIPTRPLGKNGPQVSAIGFGAMGLSPFVGTPMSDEERFKVIDRAIELGSTYIDSANIYGDNEDLLGRYFKKYPEQRQKVFLATKFAIVFNVEDKTSSVRGDAQYVREASARSFERLGLDFVDLYYVHRIDKNVPIEETIEALKELVDAGKIKYIGLSKCSSETLRRAHAVHPIAAVQIQYSLFDRDIEKEEVGLLKACRELGVAIVCYSPLGVGMLTGQYKSQNDFEENDFRPKFMPRFSEENLPKNVELIEQLTTFAKKKGCTTGQLALAWILAQGDDFFVIPGTTKIKNLEENVGAAQVKLSQEEVQEIRDYCEKNDIAGECMPPEHPDRGFGESAPKKN